MRRRDAIAFLALIPTIGMHGADAQTSGTIARIGTLDYGSLSARRLLWETFHEKLRNLGYEQGRNIAVEARWADGRMERLGPLAAELVSGKVDIIVTAGSAAALAAQQATSTIPIVFTGGGDAVKLGIVTSINRPAGNITGVSGQTDELSLKRLELLRELVPTASRLAILTDAANLAYRAEDTRAAAQSLGLSAEITRVRGPDEFDAAFAAMERTGAQALIVIPSPMLFDERQRLADLALKSRLPTVMASREYVEAGGVLGYAASLSERFSHAATYVDKILKGAKPVDLPIEQPTKFELVINFKTAKALGLDVPLHLQQRADEVIE